MTPGLALFYGGMVRKRNVLSIMMQSYAAIGLVNGLDLTQHRENAYPDFELNETVAI